MLSRFPIQNPAALARGVYFLQNVLNLGGIQHVD